MKRYRYPLALGLCGWLITACGSKEEERPIPEPVAPEIEVPVAEVPPPKNPPANERPMEERVIGTWRSVDLGDLARQGIESVQLKFTNDGKFVSSAKAGREEISRLGNYSFIDGNLQIVFQETGVAKPESASITFEGDRLVMVDEGNAAQDICVTFERED